MRGNEDRGSGHGIVPVGTAAVVPNGPQRSVTATLRYTQEKERCIYKEVPNVLGELSVEQDHKGIHLRQSGNGLAPVHVKI